MDIGDVMSDSLRYPTSDWYKLILLGFLCLISFLIIPIFLVLGYTFRVIKASLAGFEELPAFDDWGKMLVEGIKLFLVYMIYFLPAIIIGIVSFVSFWSSIMSLTYITPVNGTVSPTMLFSILGGTAIIGLIITGVYSLVIYPIMAVAIGNMAYYDGELGAAFRFGEILSLISQIGWVDLIIWYIVVILVGIVIGIISSIIGIIPILGWILITLIVYPYFYLFYARAIAWLFSSAFEEEYVP